MAIAGKDGTITVDGATICATEWTVNINTDLLDSTDFCDDGWRSFVIGLKEASGTISSYERIDSDSGTLVLGNSNAGSVTITGDVVFGSETWTNAVDGIQSFTKDFSYVGEPTIS